MPSHPWLYLLAAALPAVLLAFWVAALRARLRGTRSELAAAENLLARERLEHAWIASRAVTELERPMKLLGASLDLALRRRRDTPELAASLEDAKREVDRLAALAARIELLVEPRRKREPTDLAFLVRSAVDGQKAAAATRQVQVAVTGPERLPAALDVKAVEQSIAELLSNAIRVSRFGATVRVTLEEQAGTLRVKVSDDGPGFGNALPETVFEPFLFHRTAPAAGLGLALARKVAREHGGDVTLLQPKAGAEVVMELREITDP